MHLFANCAIESEREREREISLRERVGASCDHGPCRFCPRLDAAATAALRSNCCCCEGYQVRVRWSYGLWFAHRPASRLRHQLQLVSRRQVHGGARRAVLCEVSRAGLLLLLLLLFLSLSLSRLRMNFHSVLSRSCFAPSRAAWIGSSCLQHCNPLRFSSPCRN